MLIHNPETLSIFKTPEKEDKLIRDYYLYFLWYNETLVYIGQTVDLRNRILSHKRDRSFDKVTFELFPQTTKPEILKIEREHINHFKPTLNDDDKSVIKTQSSALQKGHIVYEINKLHLINGEAYYYDGNVVQSIKKQSSKRRYKGYFYCEDGKEKYKIKDVDDYSLEEVFYVENNKLKLQ